MKIHELLNKQEKWLNEKELYYGYTEAVDEYGNNVMSLSNIAVKWTLWGAFAKCYSNITDSRYEKIIAAMPPHKRDRELYLTNFNNRYDTTYEDIIQLAKDADV